MPTNKQIRKAAYQELKGNWTQPVLCTVVYLLVVGAVSCIPIVNFASIIVTLPLGFGFTIAFLLYMRGEDRKEMVGVPFRVFNQYGRYLGTSLLMALYIFLWTLLIVIPGIIKSYAYAMTPYICKDYPELTADECINRSKEMMNGYKWKLFLLDLSFIGWILLCILTFGIGTLWIEPYMMCSRAKFYEELKVRQLN